jgi:murein DD-endopeptidase MepM/ murein hydrolase activator NlpD
MVLAGLVAGTLTASTAFRPDTSDVRPVSTTALVAAARPTFAPARIDVASVRVQEAAVAEWEYRSSAPDAAASRSTNTPGSLIRPARGARTGWFGEDRPGHHHTGIDFDGNTGDPVVAAGAGTVVHAGPAPAGYSGYGTIVLIDHGGGITTLYAHLSRLGVRNGAVVRPGDYIGAIGTSGNVTGSHLHFEVRIGDRPVNPAPWIAGG